MMNAPPSTKMAPRNDGSRTKDAGLGQTLGNLSRGQRFGESAIWGLFAVALLLFLLGPIVLFYAQSVADGGAGITRVLETPGIWTTVATTLVIAAGSTAVAAIAALILATMIMRLPPRIRSIASMIPMLSLVIPPVALIIGWVFIFSPRVGYGNTLLRKLPMFDHLQDGPVNVYALLPIIIITGIDLAGIVFTFIFARLNEIGGSLEAAARVSGANGLTTYFTVTLPLLRPSLVASLVVVFLLGLGQFTAPLLLGTPAGIHVLSTEVFRVREVVPVDYAYAAALGLPLVAIGFASIVFQKRVVGDQRRYVTNTTVGGLSTRSSKLALVGVILYALVFVVLPLAALTTVSLSRFWSGDLANMEMTTDHILEALSNPQTTEAIGNTLLAALLAALVVLPVGFIAALATSGVVKAPRIIKTIMDVTFVGPLAVPRAMLGIVVFFVFVREPFSLYGTLALFVIGYIFIVIPFSLRSLNASLIGVHPSVYEAARVCGAGQVRMVLDIALPMARRGITAAVSIILILLTHDFAVSVMLRAPGKQVMGTVIYELWEKGIFPQVASMSLIMTVVSVLLLAVTLLVGARSSLQNL